MLLFLFNPLFCPALGTKKGIVAIKRKPAVLGGIPRRGNHAPKKVVFINPFILACSGPLVDGAAFINRKPNIELNAGISGHCVPLGQRRCIGHRLVLKAEINLWTDVIDISRAVDPALYVDKLTVVIVVHRACGLMPKMTEESACLMAV